MGELKKLYVVDEAVLFKLRPAYPADPKASPISTLLVPFPATSNLSRGFVTPIPILPLLLTYKKVDDPLINWNVAPVILTEAVTLPVIILSPEALPAFKAYDAVVAKDEVPIMLPLIFKEPVTVCTSVIRFPILTPAYMVQPLTSFTTSPTIRC